MTHRRVPLHAPVPALVATALLYMVLAEATAMVAPGLGHSQLLPSASGLALALLFIGGRRLLAGVLVGALAIFTIAGDVRTPAEGRFPAASGPFVKACRTAPKQH